MRVNSIYHVLFGALACVPERLKLDPRTCVHCGQEIELRDFGPVRDRFWVHSFSRQEVCPPTKATPDNA